MKLTENQINKLVKRVISEINYLQIPPYEIRIVNDGNLKITNNKTKQSQTYKLFKEVDFLPDVRLKVIDFVSDGSKMKVSAVGQEREVNIDKNKIYNLISNNWGEDEVRYTLKDGSTVIFQKIR